MGVWYQMWMWGVVERERERERERGFIDNHEVTEGR
jgi:hypothetical protein